MPELFNNDLVLIGAIGLFILLVFLVVSALGGSETPVNKRMGSILADAPEHKTKQTAAELGNARRKSITESLKEIEAKKTKVTLRVRLQQAGLRITPKSYYIASAGLGVICALLVMVLFSLTSPFVLVSAAFVGALGLPKLILSKLTARRQAKFLAGFANSIDLIVRGVKSGLPLNECLGIIAREAPSPICEEFADVVEQQRLGVPLGECFERMIARVPLAEVKFFAIVVSIQIQAGGNISEALGNLANVLRDRRRLADKVAGLSAEAKASAVVLASMPFIVTTMVYFSAPKYISLLWTTNVGIFLLICAGFWMSVGVFVMRSMINFKY
jgi:tight adherence protein B